MDIYPCNTCHHSILNLKKIQSKIDFRKNLTQIQSLKTGGSVVAFTQKVLKFESFKDSCIIYH